MADAAADLANRVSVRIESELNDVQAEKNGKLDYHLAAITKLTSDVKIQGLKFEVAYQGTDVYALAYVRRADAAAERRRLLERSIVELDSCMNSARDAKNNSAARVAEGYVRCLRYVSECLQHDSVIRTFDPSNNSSQTQRALFKNLQEIRDATAKAVSASVTNLKEAADSLAIQFGENGSLPYAFREAPAFRYGATNFASGFGQQLSLHLESALARRKSTGDISGSTVKDAVVRGVYFEEGNHIRISATIVEVATGRVVAGAETTLAKENLPEGVSLFPQNLESAMVDQRLLSKGELVDGSLRVDIWANKGRRGVVYSASEEIRIFVRVNAPAYLRIIYVLESGVQVPIAQAYYIDSSKVNQAVEYPERFEVTAPFGVEHIHVTAFSQQPEPLLVERRIIDGEPYDVVSKGIASVVRHRGIKRVEKNDVAESLLSITTLPNSPNPKP
jgi:hypothetical protein